MEDIDEDISKIVVKFPELNRTQNINLRSALKEMYMKGFDDAFEIASMSNPNDFWRP